MTLNLIRRPEKNLGLLTSKWTAGSSPVVYRFQREDFQISSIQDSPSFPGNMQISIPGDQTAELLTGTLVHVNGFNTSTEERVIVRSSQIVEAVFDGGDVETDVTIAEPFFAITADSGFMNNLDRSNYVVLVNLFVTETGRKLTDQQLRYFPTVEGVVIVDLQSIVNTLLDSDVPFVVDFFTDPNSLQPLFAFNFYISYQEAFDGGLAGEIIDSGNNQFAANSVRQVLEGASPNMAPYVPFVEADRQLFDPTDFVPDLTGWLNDGSTTTGVISWVSSTSDRARASGAALPIGARTRILAQNFTVDTGNDFPVIWHNERFYQIDVDIEALTDSVRLAFFDFNDGEEPLQDDYKAGILYDSKEELIRNGFLLESSAGQQQLTFLYQPGQNATRFGLAVLSTTDNFIVDVFSFEVRIPEPRWLSRAGDLKLWRGLPFSLSFIYSDLIVGLTLKSVERWIDYSGAIIQTFERDLDPALALQINSISFEQEQFITSQIPATVQFVEVEIRTDTDAKVIETKRIQVMEPCINPFYVQWVNEFAGLSYWLFDYSQELGTIILDDKKFREYLVGAENITLEEAGDIDYLNHPGPITAIRDIDPDFTIQDKTNRKQGAQVYQLFNSNSGEKRGLIVRPIPNTIRTKDTLHQLRIQLLTPERFVVV